MKQVWNIAWKDLQLMLRDRTGLLLNLGSPFALVLVIAFALGGLGSSSGSSLQNIPVVVVNLDDGPYGTQLAEILTSGNPAVGEDPNRDALHDLLDPHIMNDPTVARAHVDADEAAAAVIIPAGFSESIQPADMTQTISERAQSMVEVYANPGRPVGASVIRAVVDQVLDQFNAGAIGGEVAVTALLQSGRLSPQDALTRGAVIGAAAAQASLSTAGIELTSQVAGEAENTQQGFNWLKYSAPSVAMMYLMFTLSGAARTILVERQNGTLPRMLVSPTSRAGVIGGKMLGAYLIGLMQMAVLIIAGGLIFGFSWGPPLLVILVTLLVTAAATGWGMLEAALVKTPGQAASLGWTVNLVFAALGGAFMPRMAYPVWIQNLGLITPNAWGTEAYYALIYGGSWSDISLTLVVLAGMTLILFAAAVLLFRRKLD